MSTMVTVLTRWIQILTPTGRRYWHRLTSDFVNPSLRWNSISTRRGWLTTWSCYLLLVWPRLGIALHGSRTRRQFSWGDVERDEIFLNDKQLYYLGCTFHKSHIILAKTNCEVAHQLLVKTFSSSKFGTTPTCTCRTFRSSTGRTRFPS